MRKTSNKIDECQVARQKKRHEYALTQLLTHTQRAHKYGHKIEWHKLTLVRANYLPTNKSIQQPKQVNPTRE